MNCPLPNCWSTLLAAKLPKHIGERIMQLEWLPVVFVSSPYNQAIDIGPQKWSLEALNEVSIKSISIFMLYIANYSVSHLKRDCVKALYASWYMACVAVVDHHMDEDERGLYEEPGFLAPGRNYSLRNGDVTRNVRPPRVRRDFQSQVETILFSWRCPKSHMIEYYPAYGPSDASLNTLLQD